MQKQLFSRIEIIAFLLAFIGLIVDGVVIAATLQSTNQAVIRWITFFGLVYGWITLSWFGSALLWRRRVRKIFYKNKSEEMSSFFSVVVCTTILTDVLVAPLGFMWDSGWILMLLFGFFAVTGLVWISMPYVYDDVPSIFDKDDNIEIIDLTPR